MIELEKRDPGFVFELKEKYQAPATLAQCFRCGACSGICPVEKVQDDFDPRVIVHGVLLGLKDRFLKTETIWKCSGCGSCVPVCPMEVKPMEVIKALKAVVEERDPECALEMRFKVGRLARVIADKCIACLTCVRDCPFKAPYITEEGYAVIQPDKCRACGICVVECPARAIVLNSPPEMTVLKSEGVDA
ncbi:4Fe-4S ferredoxin iron-sulfur binding domain protein [Thermodesulfatator indicus DSM 15286]|uniref:4Fe-4S ferredoxin iron-sulfur binding domain protein n=1 Tax=Thermodesulfatator indicus (strain DSM 15286 / JCM 11887 / CIR29812) TaxID=667014 RepID=F8ADS5_THEID|nr:4Fe-4S binding protein [Thermodesulfatator indicus]AEH46035.1 4Fe-4S ferredoxin iron-sulfur binding domain protein [Thermodesulfatator indicus DSM 15286]